MTEIAVDSKELAKTLGLEEWPEGQAGIALDTDIAAMAARTVTDLHRGKFPAEALGNAKSWIHHAYNDGKNAGIREERSRWIDKITRLFIL